MVNRVVATKLTEEEHTQLLDVCNREGCTPSSLIHDAVLKRIEPEPKKDIHKMTIKELNEILKK